MKKSENAAQRAALNVLIDVYNKTKGRECPVPFEKLCMKHGAPNRTVFSKAARVAGLTEMNGTGRTATYRWNLGRGPIPEDAQRVLTTIQSFHTGVAAKPKTKRIAADGVAALTDRQLLAELKRRGYRGVVERKQSVRL